MPIRAQAWRPTIVALVNRSEELSSLADSASLFSAGNGLTTLLRLVSGDAREIVARRDAELAQIRDFLAQHGTDLFPEVVVSKDLDVALRVFLQGHSLDPIRPNCVLLGYPRDKQLNLLFASQLRIVLELRKSALVLINRASQPIGDPSGQRIDVWWRGSANGSVMLILARILRQNPAWGHTSVRILRLLRQDSEREAAQRELKRLVDSSGIPASVSVLVSTDPFSYIMRRESAGAAAVFLGFVLPNDDPQIVASFDSTAKALEGMPPAFLVCSAGDADRLR